MENKLSENFRFKGFRYTQIDRNNNFAIYLQENDVPIGNKEYFFYYEVIKIKKQKAHSSVIQGKEIYHSAKEIYPNSKAWGLSGWTFKNFSEAEEHFIRLTKKVPYRSEGTVKTEDFIHSSAAQKEKQLKILKTI